jgi:fibronectin type 3 domain-containing protein
VTQQDDRTRGRRRPRRWLVRLLGVAVVGAVALSGTGSVPLGSDLQPASLTDPVPPTNVVATSADRALQISWTPSTETSVSGYDVYVDGAVTRVGNVNSVTVGSLTNGHTYTVTVYTRTSAFLTPTYTGTMSSTPVSGTPRDSVAPAAPAGVTATAGERQVRVTWTPNTTDADADGYRVLRDGVPVPGLLAGRATASWTDTAVVPDQTYGYTVQTHDTSGNWSASSAPVASARPFDHTPPATPTGLTAVAGDGRVELRWTANTEPDLAHYVVLRDGVEVARVTGTSYTDTTVVNDTTYAYRLVAVDAYGNASPASDPAVTARPTDLTAPATPTGLTAEPGDGRVRLSWTPNAEPDVAEYVVYRDDQPVVRVPRGDGPSWIDTGVVNDTTYAYRLVAVDGHGNASPATDPPVSARPTDTTAPAVPRDLAAHAGDGRVDLSWTADTEPDLATYVVYRDDREVARVPRGDGPSWTDTGVVNGTTYAYRLAAVDTHGNVSAASDPAVTARPTDTTAPAVPRDLAATAGDGRVVLTWTANPEPDVARYVVYRDGAEVARVSGTSWTDTGVVNGTSYAYRLAAVDQQGNASAASDPAVTARPTDTTAPATPTGLRAEPGDGQVVLSWMPNPEPDVAEYVVLRDEQEVARVGDTSWTDTGVVNDTTYAYRLIAVDGHGNASPASDPAVPATPTTDRAPAAPAGPTATAGDGRAVLRWTAVPEPDVTAYRVLAEDGGVVATVAAPATQATVTGLVNGTERRFRVVAVDAAGQVSPPSAEVAVTPVAARVPVEGSGQSGGVAAGADGRVVVIGTSARWEPTDTNTAYELYVLDRAAGTARRIAPLPASATGSSDPTNAAAPVVSDDGRYVALATTAALLAEDTNRLADVYRFDTRDGTWQLVSVPAGGRVHASVAGTVLQGGASVYATSPTVVTSGDGDLVLFYSARADLVPGDTNGAVDVFAKRMSTGAVTRVSTTSAGGNLPRTATGPALAVTPDGRFALFPAASGTGPVVLYRKTLSGPGAGQAVVVSSVVAAGRTTEFGVYRDAGDVAVSDDGRHVALVTAAKVTTPTPTAAWSTGLAYRVDTVTGAVVAMGSGQTTVWEHQVELDPTGRYGFYATAAAALPGDGNGHTDHYRRDLDGGGLTLVTADAAGRATTGPTGAVTTAEYGRLTAVDGDRVVVTTSQALTPTDTNRLRDLYVKDLTDGTVTAPGG